MDRLTLFGCSGWNAYFYCLSVGLKKPTAEDLYEERDRRMRAQYLDPIEHFPTKIDQLSEVVKQVSIPHVGRFGAKYLSTLCRSLVLIRTSHSTKSAKYHWSTIDVAVTKEGNTQLFDANSRTLMRKLKNILSALLLC